VRQIITAITFAADRCQRSRFVYLNRNFKAAPAAQDRKPAYQTTRVTGIGDKYDIVITGIFEQAVQFIVTDAAGVGIVRIEIMKL
jgi:hypothetical protein